MGTSLVSSKLLLIFRILIVLQLANLVILTPLYGVYLDRYAGGATEIAGSGSQLALLLHLSYMIVALVLYLLAYVGLFFLSSWARALLLVAVAISWLEPFVNAGIYNYSRIEETLSNISDTIDGVLIAMMWASSVSAAFVRGTWAQPRASARSG
jgi:hypothetical protein